MATRADSAPKPRLQRSPPRSPQRNPDRSSDRSADRNTDRNTDNAALWKAYRRDPTDARRNGLVEAYQHLAKHVVARFAVRLPRSVDRGDLVTAANVGLIRAIGSFDPQRGVRFEAYGERRIHGALLDELRTQDWLPRPWRQRVEQHKRVVERLRGKLDREPHDDEVASALDLPEADYRLLFGTGLPGSPAGSMPPAAGDEDGATGLDVVPDLRLDAPEDRLSREELLSLVAERLTEQEYRIVYLKYWEELSMREIGELTGLSESRVCKIHARLIERLQERLAAHGRDE